MPTPSDQASGQEQSLTNQFASLTGEQIYDSIMSGIEPELVLANLESLDEPYAAESEEERSARYERYGKAFAQYRIKYASWIDTFKNVVDAYRKAFSRASESVNREDEDLELESLSSLMLSA